MLILQPDDGFPSSNQEDSGYILLLIALIIAGSITQSSVMELMCGAFEDMQIDQAEESIDYGALTRKWVSKIMDDGDLLDSLTSYLALLINPIYRNISENENEDMSLADQILDKMRIGESDFQ